MTKDGTPASEDFSSLVARYRDGSPELKDRLLALLYEELHRVAKALFRRERAGHTLQPTALVHEAFLRLSGGASADWRSRSEVVGIAARAMRCVLVDHARGRNAQKRGGGRGRVTLRGLEGADGLPSYDALDVAAALDDLSRISERQARIVELRFFAGLGEAEIAESLGVSTRTVRVEWRLARALLREQLAGDA